PGGTGYPPQFGEIELWQLASVEQTAPNDDAQDGLVSHPRHYRADFRETRSADIDRGDAIGSSDTLRVVVGVERDDAPHPAFELRGGGQRDRRTHRLACEGGIVEAH